MENTNKSYFLKLFLGLVFLSAGIYRVFNIQAAIKEFSIFPEPLIYPFIIFTIIIEILGGVLLLLNKKTKIVAIAFSLFIIFAIISAFIISGKEIVSNSSELFSFDTNPTDVFMHFTYLIILIYIII